MGCEDICDARESKLRLNDADFRTDAGPVSVMRTKVRGSNGKPRLLIFAPHFAEYSTRLVEALKSYADILFILDREARQRECEASWFRAATAGVRLMEFRSTHRLVRLLWTPLVLARCLLFRPDILHSHEQADRLSALIVGVFGPRIPLVLTVHDPKSHMGRDAEANDTGGRRRRLDMGRRLASLFHVHGDYCRRLLLEVVGDARPIVSTHHGIVQEPSPGEERHPEPGRILFFGRMEEYKGINVLVDAFERLNARGRNYSLVLAGDGPALDKERAKKTRGITLINCFIPREEAIAELQRASLVAMPYLEATQSGVAAAAIGNGRAMVGSAVGGLAEVIREDKNGLLIPAADAGKLADAIDRVFQEPGLLEKLSAGSRQSREELSWGRIARTLHAAYSAALYERVNSVDSRPAANSASAR